MDKVFIVKGPYDPARRVVVYRNPIDGQFWVEQNEKVVIVCNHIVLRDCQLCGQLGQVMGYVSSTRALNDLHTLCCHDENDCFPFCTIEWDLKDGYTADGEPIQWADFLDIDTDSMLGIFPGGHYVS